MPGLLPDVDPDGLLEYSVVFTDRSLNHMSQAFQGVMNDISASLQRTYNADEAVVVPGGGTYAMEAVARQFATAKRCLVIRNGWFSFRWTQIFEMGDIPSEATVLQARRADNSPQPAFAPVPIEEAVAAIAEQRPQVVFAAHVETSAGMLLPPDYVQALAEAVHAVGGMLVLDCIASGAIWVDMRTSGVDVLISAPQKGWSGPPCAGLVMLNQRAREALASSTSTSFACDLGKWSQIMQAYVNGGHAYHATLPTDSLRAARDAMRDTESFGLEQARERQQALGDAVRALLAERGFKSVAAEGFRAPGVVVCYTSDPDIHNGRKFAAAGLQIAAGVPLRCGEPEDFRTFRLGLFGLDKLSDVERTLASLARALDAID